MPSPAWEISTKTGPIGCAKPLPLFCFLCRKTIGVWPKGLGGISALSSLIVACYTDMFRINPPPYFLTFAFVCAWMMSDLVKVFPRTFLFSLSKSPILLLDGGSHDKGHINHRDNLHYCTVDTMKPQEEWCHSWFYVLNRLCHYVFTFLELGNRPLVLHSEKSD